MRSAIHLGLRTLFPGYMHSLTDIFELRGVQVSTCEITTANSAREARNCSCKQCCAVFRYGNYVPPNMTEPSSPSFSPKRISEVVTYTSKSRRFISGTIIVALTFIYKSVQISNVFMIKYMFFLVRLQFL